MARRNSKTRPLVSFNQPVMVQVHEPAFTLARSLRFLDIAVLAKAARAEVEIGEIDGGCCHHKVRVTIRKGMVVKLHADPCKKEGQARLPPDLAKVVKESVRRVRAKRGRARSLPVPVSTFFASSAAARLITVETLRCIRLCIFGICVTCCWREDLPDAEPVCGRVTIDTTKPGLVIC
jgi:hypothetical protein